MKHARIVLCILAAALSLCLSSCAAKQFSSERDNASPQAGATGSASGFVKEEDANKNLDAETLTDDKGSANADQKRIKTVSLSMQTQTFDELLAQIQTALTSAGGYVQSAEQSGSANVSGNRYATMMLRVPAGKSENFLNTLTSAGTVLSRTENVEDVTLSYIDMESKLASLRTEQTALLGLLEKASSLSDILTLQERLSQVRGEIESYEAQLRRLDTLVTYTTVTLTLREVERETPVAATGTWEEIGTNLSNNLYAIGRFFTRLFIWFVSALPYLLLLAAVGVVIWLIVRRTLKAAAKKRTSRPAAYVSSYSVSPPMPPTPPVQPSAPPTDPRV